MNKMEEKQGLGGLMERSIPFRRAIIKIGNTTGEISNQIGRVFFRNQSIGELESTLGGRKIALVGNGPIDGNKGGEIDAHDTVIRLNRGQYKNNLQRDITGERSDIWGIGSPYIMNDQEVSDEINRLSGDVYLLRPLVYFSMRIVDTLKIKNKQKISTVGDGKLHDDITRETIYNGVPFIPTTGYQALRILLEAKVAEISLYGFTFNGKDHRIDTNRQQAISYHSPAVEEARVKDLIRLGKKISIN